LPAISVNELQIPYYWDPKSYIIQNVSLKWPFVTAIKVARDKIEFIQPSLHRGRPGPSQVFRLKHIRTGFGLRHAFVCDCGRSVFKVYCCNRHLACRRCHHATYASRTLGKRTRPLLQAARIQSFLDNKPRLFRRTHERLLRKLGQKTMMAQNRLATRARSLWE
jgi:hypothetical protein